jgi:hypothetical protein
MPRAPSKATRDRSVTGLASTISSRFKSASTHSPSLSTRANDWAKCLSVRQLNQIFKTGGATKWNQIDPSWPDQNIAYYYPGKDSGTYDYFQETILTSVDGSQHYDGLRLPRMTTSSLSESRVMHIPSGTSVSLTTWERVKT